MISYVPCVPRAAQTDQIDIISKTGNAPVSLIRFILVSTWMYYGTVCQGLMRSNPHSAKSSKLRVATAEPRERAIAAI